MSLVVLALSNLTLDCVVLDFACAVGSQRALHLVTLRDFSTVDETHAVL